MSFEGQELFALDYPEFRRRTLAAYLLTHLEANDWNVTAMARKCKINRQHVYKLCKRFKIKLQAPVRPRPERGLRPFEIPRKA